MVLAFSLLLFFIVCPLCNASDEIQNLEKQIKELEAYAPQAQELCQQLVNHDAAAHCVRYSKDFQHLQSDSSNSSHDACIQSFKQKAMESDERCSEYRRVQSRLTLLRAELARLELERRQERQLTSPFKASAAFGCMLLFLNTLKR